MIDTPTRADGGQLAIKIKPYVSRITEVHQAGEETIREILIRKMPDHGALGEEFVLTNLNQQHVWVLDPIAGTKQFAAGLASFEPTEQAMSEFTPGPGSH